MADIYDYRLDEHEGGGRFLVGLLTGAALGAALGILFAPKAGSELRSRLSERAGTLATQAQDGIRKARENAGQWAEKGKATAGDLADRGRDMGKDMYGKARDFASRDADDVSDSGVRFS